MFRYRFIIFAFMVHYSTGQFFPGFAPFQGPPPPISIMFVQFSFPPVTLQAKAGGGLQASIPDDCGIENFEFESRKKPSDPWKGGNVTSKTEGNWIFNDPVIVLTPGEILIYRCRVKQRGNYVSNPDVEWVVPDLAEEFDPPKPPMKTEDCPEDLPTPKPDDKKDETTAKPDDKKEETTAKPDDKKDDTTAKPDDEEATSNPDEESTDKPEKNKKELEKQKPDTRDKIKMAQPDNVDENPKSPECPAPGPKPGETREEALERKLWKVQCDMLQLAERSLKLNEALSFELTELKKLNYVVVTRIQRLETLLRNLNRPAPFPYY